MPSPRPRLAALLLLAASATAGGGCAVARYAGDRALDVIDVVDLKHGFGTDTMGLGLKLELTEFFAIALGYGRSDDLHEGRGRRADAADDRFAHYLVFGGDGPTDRPTLHFYGWNTFYYGPLWQQWRVGLELSLPLARVGAYLNLMEIVDLLAGLVTLDPSQDDGVPHNAPLELEDAP